MSKTTGDVNGYDKVSIYVRTDKVFYGYCNVQYINHLSELLAAIMTLPLLASVCPAPTRGRLYIIRAKFGGAIVDEDFEQAARAANSLTETGGQRKHRRPITSSSEARINGRSIISECLKRHQTFINIPNLSK